MIQGFIQLEDNTINFRIIPEDTVIYTVTNALSGENTTIDNVPSHLFFAALACALDKNGELHTPNVDYSELEEIMPESDNLRWIP